MTGTVIVGAGIAGLATAESLRRMGYTAPITLLGDETARPYSRPALSKEFLMGAGEPSSVEFVSDLDAQGIQLRTGVRATALDVGRHTVFTSHGVLDYDTLVIATGSRANRVAPPSERVHSLRSVSDAVAVRAAMHGARRVIVVGAGVLGNELASAARKLGAAAVLVGRDPSLTVGGAGGEVGASLRELHRAHSVELVLGRRVVAIDDSHGSVVVRLDGGMILEGDVLLDATGALPEVNWLSGSGLPTSSGLRCGDSGLVVPGIYAVGDVAERYSDPPGGWVTVGHQTAAIEGAHAAAAHLVAGQSARRPIPFFWTEVHGVRIQAEGWFRGLETRVVERDPHGDGFLAVALDGTSPRGVLAWNAPRMFTRGRRALRDDSLLTSADSQIGALP